MTLDIKWKFWGAVSEVLDDDKTQFDYLTSLDLEEHYKDREYHNLYHIESIIRGLTRFKDITPRERALMTIAAWYHDYHKHSVEKSADEAERFMIERGFNKRDRWFVFSMIMGTAVGAVPSEKPSIKIRQAQFRDVDWSILASTPPPAYNRYVAMIEAEFSEISPVRFNTYRLEFLRDYANRDRLFWTDVMELECGDAARSNMLREIVWRDVYG